MGAKIALEWAQRRPRNAAPQLRDRLQRGEKPHVRKIEAIMAPGAHENRV